MMAYRPDIEILPLRGNVDTRLKKLSTSELDGLVLAAAGLARLGLLHCATEHLDDDVCLSAPGQGAIGIESRSEDERLYRALDDHPSRMEVEAERAFLRRLQGGCRVPIAARARVKSAGLRLKGLVCSPDGKVRIASESEGQASDGEGIGCRLAEEILARGAAEILEEMT
jgi:hydroxymethylbilane synthase